MKVELVIFVELRTHVAGEVKSTSWTMNNLTFRRIKLSLLLMKTCDLLTLLLLFGRMDSQIGLPLKYFSL